MAATAPFSPRPIPTATTTATGRNTRSCASCSTTPELLDNHVLPDGPTALGHPTNEDLFAGTPVRAATSWRVYRSCRNPLWSSRWSGFIIFRPTGGPLSLVPARQGAHATKRPEIVSGSLTIF